MKPVIRTKIINLRESRLTRVLFVVSLFLFMSVKGWGQPIADFYSNITEVCSGSSVIFTNNTTNTTGSTTYSWNFGVGASPATATGVGPHTVTYIGVGTVTVTLSVTDDAGSDTKTKVDYITVIALPPGAAGTIAGTASVCGGQAGVIYSVPAIANATSYNWTLPVGATISAGVNTNSITVTFSPIAVSGNITVQGNNSCGTGSVSANYAVTVNPLPTTSAIYHQ
jgi:PKD repeat protein